MDNKIIAAVDEEIARLQQVRSILAGGGGFPGPFKKRRGGKRTLSAEARERIAAAQRKRWAAQKKAAK
jgi:hypothetical protein